MNDTGLPEFRVVEAALRTTTRRLAREISQPSLTAPGWNDFEWDVARAVAAMQGITVLLSKRLRWRGPPAWQEFLDTQTCQALQRDARIESLLSCLDSALREQQVACTGLKGCAVRALRLHGPGERPMGDVDLLLRPQDAVPVNRALESLDYLQVAVSRRHHIYAPRDPGPGVQPGEHPDNPLKIELHFRISEALPVRHVDITAGLAAADPRPGLNVYASLRELFRHLLLHAAGNMRAHALRQIQLYEIAHLSPWLEPADWACLLASTETEGGAWWMWPVLDLASRYHPVMPPVISEFRALTPRWLRAAAADATLEQLSWSNLRIAAFPGIEWSRSPFEALRFMRSRLVPERAALADLAIVRKAQPAMMALPWYGSSHARRILRWMVSRPPRVQTVVCLQAALDTHKPA